MPYDHIWPMPAPRIFVWPSLTQSLLRYILLSQDISHTQLLQYITVNYSSLLILPVPFKLEISIVSNLLDLRSNSRWVADTNCSSLQQSLTWARECIGNCSNDWWLFQPLSKLIVQRFLHQLSFQIIRSSTLLCFNLQDHSNLPKTLGKGHISECLSSRC